MKSYIYKAIDSLQTLINQQIQEQINTSLSVLIQVFSGEDATKIQSTLQELHQLFPRAYIITSSTDGEIYQESVLTQSTVVTITTFQDTTLKIAFCDAKESFSAGENLAKEIITQDTKLVIAFANGLLCNGEDFLDGITAHNPNILVAGGLSGDNAQFKKCYVGMNESLYDRGAVAISLNSKTLQVHNLYSFGWRAVGIKHTITKSDKNRLYSIDDLPAVEFYRKYLGDAIAEKLPATGIEFPLIIDHDGFKKARAVTARHEDGSLSFAGNIKEGESAYLGIADTQTILSNHIENTEDLNVETFFIYSCMARRRFLPDLIHTEIAPFAAMAPTSGFFTYGEFYTDTKPYLLNQTLTAVALSESKTTKNKPYKQHNTSPTNTTIEALMHIISVTSQELHEQTLLQEKVNKELDAKTNTLQVIQEMSNLANWELDLKTMQVTWSRMSYKIYNIDPKAEPPSYLEFVDMILPDDRKLFTSFQEKLKDGKVHSIEIRIQRNDGKILNIIESAKILLDNQEPIKLVGTALDITDIRTKDNLLMQQSKSAQMGEMINMIAHQWRQPLNAISSASIKLGMQSDMDILTKDEIAKTVHFIEDMTQKMSQIINDFMEFNKPTNKKEHINFHEILEDILKIMGTQLANHDIEVNISIETELQIFTYKKELEHILMNLIANARDALQERDDSKKKIAIDIYTKEKLCVVKVSDNAGGIDDDVITRVFDPYFTTKDSNKGTGLGLYMSKKILKEHLNGDIFVRNKNEGAEFTILLDMNNE